MPRLWPQKRLSKKLISKTKCGVISITGFPNSGKSTLINSFVKSKISIVSHKVQTTQEAVKGIINISENQLIFIDTPGIVRVRKHFNKRLSRSITENENICDINLLVVDVTKKLEKKSLELIKELLKVCNDNFLVLNKIDLIKRTKLLEISKLINQEFKFKNTFMISAKKGEGVGVLLNEILNFIPFNPWVYKNKKQSTDKDIIFQISEITREKIFQLINKEIPYTIKIETSIKKKKKIYIIEQRILVKKTSHKLIIIGKMGDKIKKIGSRSRLDIEKILKSKVFLKLNVVARSKKNED